MMKLLLLLFVSCTLVAGDDLYQIYLDKGENYTPRTKHLENGKAKFVNELIKSTSPYLLQHAHNPVHWKEFNQRTLDFAKKNNKLIFLSIGYATCHWCHVMEEESFEDLEVAKVINDNFVAIKVDREVLPDVDSHFMEISILTTGRGGWPLNVILTPDGDGFYAGIYFPKHELIKVLNDMQNLWVNEKSRVINQVERIKKALYDENNFQANLGKNLQSVATKNILKHFDEFYGGFGNAPKFPKESALLMLLNEQLRNPDTTKLNAITTTLDKMALGGMYDVVGGGFHRYSTDNKWLIPHFEKMLYNQSQLAMVYSLGYKLTGKELYKRVAQKTLEYALNDLQDKNGGFYSGTDAGNTEKEGVFFTWKKQELQKILGKDFITFSKYFDISSSSIFKGKHIIRYKDDLNLSAADFEIIDTILTKLANVRNTREKPLLDNKIILAHNAMMAKSLLIAGDIIDKKYITQGLKTLDFLAKFNTDKNLLRISVDNHFSTPAIFLDYAYLADAYLQALYATDNNNYLKSAKTMMRSAISKFWDSENSAFNMSNNPMIYNKKKEIYDGAIPSSNGVAYNVLNKLSRITGDNNYQYFAKKLLTTFSGKIKERPESYATIVRGWSDYKLGEITNKIYAYNGKVVITKTNNNIAINLQKGWHINSNTVLQKGLVATSITGDITNIIYPKHILMNLGFSDTKLAVYENNITITFKEKSFNPKITLKLQACNDEVCLPPQTILLH